MHPATAPITVPRNATVAFRVLVSGRDRQGQHHVAFEAGSVATLTIGGTEWNIVAHGIAGAEMRWVTRVELAGVSY